MALLALCSIGCSERVRFKGDFELQVYELPNGQGYRHMTAFVREDANELVLFGGLGNGPPSPPTPMNHVVYTLDFHKPAAKRVWEARRVDTVVERPWFTSTRGFIEVDDKIYLTCDDTDENAVYQFEPKSYAFKRLSASTLGADVNGGDCCAVGVKVKDGAKDDVRIYIMGGRVGDSDPLAHVRYYSVTNDRWVRVSDMNVGRSHLACAPAKPDGKPVVYALGGGNSPAGTALRSMELYDVLRDEWTLYEDFLPQGRTRFGVQNLEDKWLILIGGDAACAGGGQNNRCTGDHPLTNVDVVDIERGNRFVSGLDHEIPQLNIPRQTPGTALRLKKDGPRLDQYELYVVGGRTLRGTALDVATSTEVLSFDLVRARGW